ncbi:RL12 protein, partial [Crocuta crocuta]
VHLIPAAFNILLKFSLNKINVVYPRYLSGEIGATSALTTRICPKTVCGDMAKAMGNCAGLGIADDLTMQNSQAQIEMVTSAFDLNTKTFKKRPRDRKESEN